MGKLDKPIRLSKKTHSRLEKLLRGRDTFDDLINRLIDQNNENK